MILTFSLCQSSRNLDFLNWSQAPLYRAVSAVRGRQWRVGGAAFCMLHLPSLHAGVSRNARLHASLAKLEVWQVWTIAQTLRDRCRPCAIGAAWISTISCFTELFRQVFWASSHLVSPSHYGWSFTSPGRIREQAPQNAAVHFAYRLAHVSHIHKP